MLPTDVVDDDVDKTITTVEKNLMKINGLQPVERW